MKRIIPIIIICFFCNAQEAQDVTPAGVQPAAGSGGADIPVDPVFDGLFTSEEMSQLDTTQHPIPSELVDARKNASRELINQGFWKGMFNFLRGNRTLSVAIPEVSTMAEKDNCSKEEK